MQERSAVTGWLPVDTGQEFLCRRPRIGVYGKIFGIWEWYRVGAIKS